MVEHITVWALELRSTVVVTFSRVGTSFKDVNFVVRAMIETTPKRVDKANL